MNDVRNDGNTKLLTEALANPGPLVAEVISRDVEMTVSGVTDRFAEYIIANIYNHDGAAKLMEINKLSAEAVTDAIRQLFNLRFQQVSGGSSTTKFYRLAMVPSGIYALLESIGKYEGPEEGIFLKPSTSEFSFDLSLNEKVMRVVSVAGMPVAAGLPRVLTIPDDGIYRLSIKDEKVYATIRGQQVDPFTLLARTFIEFVELTDVYGPYRFQYRDVLTINTALERLSKLGMSESARL